ncbi:MAG: hypothetical protein ACLFQK_06110 [Fibrobacterota bacterium]
MKRHIIFFLMFSIAVLAAGVSAGDETPKKPSTWTQIKSIFK